MESFKKLGLLNQCLLAVAFIVFSPSALAQEKYPTRPIDLIVPGGPGGGADQVARKLGRLLEAEMKVSFPILNVPGASGNTAMAKLLTSAADGQSIVMLVSNTFAQFAGTPPTWKLDDIVILGTVTNESSAFFVAYNSKWKTWSNFENEVKAKPASLKLAGTGVGSADELTMSYLASKGIRLVYVPFAKAGERFISLLGGHADVLYEQPGEIRNYIENKQLRPILFFAPRRVSSFKEVPVSKEVGYDVMLSQYRVLAVKKGTDSNRVGALSAAIAKTAISPEFKAFLRQQWIDENSYMAGNETEAFVRDQIQTTKRIRTSIKR